MGLISKTVIMKWGNNRKIYEPKGYVFTEWKDEFVVNVEDLQDGSHALVDVKCDCDDCKNPYLKQMTFKTFNVFVHKDGKYYCLKCARKLFGKEKNIKTLLKNGSKSFYDWCASHKREDIINRWDYDLNIDKNGNKISPKNITFSSTGFNRKGYWFKCDKNPKHESELKCISGFTSGQRGNLECNQCHSFGQWCLDNNKQDILDRWDYKLNDINPFKISYGSTGLNGKGYWFKCLEHPEHHSELKSITSLTSGKQNRINCHQCNSIGQYLINLYGKEALDLYWDYYENNKLKFDPMEMARGNTLQKVFIKCQNKDKTHHESYPTYCNSFITGSRCPRCQLSKGEKILKII